MIEVSTRLGPVRGSREGPVSVFRGLPYGAPPVGTGRFGAPRPAPRWAGTFDATGPHRRAWQPPPPAILGSPPLGEMSEDCLCLTVTTPAPDVGRRPVLFWIHGGAFTMGSASEYDATVLAAQGDVVVVTINYRLGVFGFLDLSAFGERYATSANNGLLDQIAALEWVRDNIDDYGGDPDNVTIFGESAGGLSVLSLLAAPGADGLYHRAIAHSPGLAPIAPPVAHLDALSTIFDATDGGLLERLVEAEPASLIEAQKQLTILSGGRVDGVVVTRSTVDAITERGRAGVPLIAGSNHDEGTLFSSLRATDADPAELTDTARRVVGGGDPTGLLDGLERLHPDDDPRTHYEQLWTDFFRRAAVEAAGAAAAHAPGGWLYRFDLPETVLGGALGATHGSEIAFTFNTLGRGISFHDPGDAGAAALAEAWSGTVLAFARTGDPNGAGLPDWPRYDNERRPCLVLDWESFVVEDPDRDHRQLWDAAAS